LFSGLFFCHVSCSFHDDLGPVFHISALLQAKKSTHLSQITLFPQFDSPQSACQSGKWVYVNFLEVAPMGLKTVKVKIENLVISPSLSPEYRRMLLGLTYRVSSFAQIPEPLLLDYIMAHPPIGKKVGHQFHVVANIRTLALKPFLRKRQ
jgi:hypothetical protein